MKLKLMEGKALTQLIGSIGKARVQLDGQIQLAAVQCIAQSIVHRNTTPANALMGVVSKHHVATVVAYLERFGNFAYEKKGGKLDFLEVYKVEELEKAIANIGDAKWFDAKKPAKVVSQYDYLQMCSDFFERCFKTMKKEGVEHVNKPILNAAYAAYCEAVSKAYGEGEKSLEQQAIDTALDSRGKGLATPAQLKMLAEHFGRPITQHEETPSAKEAAIVEEAKQFGALPRVVSQ
jgi:hypothetical protein